MIAKIKIHVDVYECDVHFVVTDNMPTTVTEVSKSMDMVCEDRDKTAEGLFLSGDSIKSYAVIIDKSCLTHNTIAHELYHMTRTMEEDRDLGEEAGAWINGYLAAKFYNFLKTKNIDVG